ncbi:MAG: hypothetical protein Q4B40_04925 [Clostridia bacterium]|nr:hypothetical protein [Clostridia bacterium]
MKQAISNAKKLITAISVLSILAVSIFSAFIGVDFTATAEVSAAPSIWGGYTANTPNAMFEGEGTAVKPYLITNGDQLWKMIKSYGVQGNYTNVKYDSKTNTFNAGNVEVFPAYYQLANDIYLNDISKYDEWGSSGFDMSTLNNWLVNAGNNATFFGQLDGNGYTVYGLYATSASKTAFIPNVGQGASIKNLHFRNTFILNTCDLGYKVDDSLSDTEHWNVLVNGAAAVLGAYYEGDNNADTVDVKISNCSILEAYVESKYGTAGLIGYRDPTSIPTVKNCIIADTTLKSTELNQRGAILNSAYGPYETKTVAEAVISIGNPFYGTGYFKSWSGDKVPQVTQMFKFIDCYSDIRHSFSVEHPDHGKCTHSETSINLTKDSRVKGEAAKENLDIDWEHNWKTTDGYPIPNNEYIVPTGDEYYANGGPKSDTNYWNGKAAKTFAAGTGTVDDPYLIETCGQFYKMVTSLNTTDYYKVADGVKSLYFNKVEGMTYEEMYEYLSNSKRANVYNPGNNNFNGYFDGNGVTIYGVKAVGELAIGLFPKVNSSTIKNFTVKNSYFYAHDDKKSETVVEGASAVVADLVNNAAVSIRNIAVIDCYVNSPTRAAGLVACSHTGGAVFVDDCVVSGGQISSDEGTTGTAAFVAGSNSGTHTIRNSISRDVYPAADNTQSYNSSFINVYTSFDPPSSLVEAAAKGVIEVEDANLLGTKVKTTASQFDWENNWSTTDKVPMPKVHKAVFGEAGKPWSGKIADAYAGGTGTATNPYQIDTPERLAQMIMYCKPGAYYTLTENIIINDGTTFDWFTSNDVAPFTGIFDGNGKTISGLYYADVKSGAYAGLIPLLGSGAQVRNLFVADSVLNGSAGAVIGTIVGSVADGANDATTIRACYVDDSVKLTGAANASGVVGRVGLAKLKMDNSLSAANLTGVTGNKSGLVGEVVGKLEIKECISAGTYPFAASDKIVATSIYTDVAGSVAGVITVENGQMKGENAKTYLTALDFNAGGTWTTTADDYPTPTGNSKPFDGVPGEPWSGEIAINFAGGNGSVSDPYKIATGEQLALMLTGNYCSKNFKLIGDIYLNDVYDPLWKDLVGCSSWFSTYEMNTTFTGTFDGDGYGVFGMYYNNPSAAKNTFVALFPRIGESAVIKNVAVSHAYIDANIFESEAYAGGIFGNCGNLRNGISLYTDKARPADTVGDKYKDIPLPVIENCIVDHNSVIMAGNVGGIGCPGGGVVVIRDCIVTATVTGEASNKQGALIGNTWSGGQRLYDSLAFTQNDIKSSAGVHQWIEDEANIWYYHEDVYYYGSTYIYGTLNVPRPQWRVGAEVKTACPNLDWYDADTNPDGNWRTVEADPTVTDSLDGTPIPVIFDKPRRSGDVFSDKTFNIPDVQINFITGDEAINVDPLIGKPYEDVNLPTVSRLGYKFTGWYSFSDITLPYPYEYFLSRDINLYAGWEKVGIIQDFESYLYSSYDCDTERWNYNKPGSRGGYNFDYVHGGTKSMQLLNTSAESADVLINYEEWLTPGQTYTMTFWVATDAADTNATMSLVHNNHPDYLGTEVASEPMVTVTGQKVGEWKQYSYNFTAQTNWISLRATGNSSLFIDDIVIAPTGTILENNNYVNGDISSVSPQTASGVVVGILISALVACTVIAVLSKKNFTEVVERI